MDELQGILTTYEMRTSNENPSNKEATFKATKKDKKKVEIETNNRDDSKENMEEFNFVKNLKRACNIPLWRTEKTYSLRTLARK